MKDIFSPPVREAEIATLHRNLAGELDRATILLTDDDKKVFSLTIATSHDFRQNTLEDIFDNQPVDEEEPIFVVPDKEISTDLIQEIVAMPHELLAHYLVAQAENSSEIN